MSLKSRAFMGVLVVGCVSLAGCAGHHNSAQALQQASTDFQAVK